MEVCGQKEKAPETAWNGLRGFLLGWQETDGIVLQNRWLRVRFLLPLPNTKARSHNGCGLFSV